MDTLPSSLRASVLAILLFDEARARTVRHALPIEVWNSEATMYAFLKRVYEYIDTYKIPPKDHLVDLINELELEEDKRDILTKAIDRSIAKFQANLNFEYIMDQVNKFHRQTSLRSSIQKSVELLETGKLDEVEETLNAALRKKLDLFKPGISLLDGVQFLRDELNTEISSGKVLLDVPALDSRLIVPTPKELMLLVAAAKRGKSWFLIHVGKQAIMQGKKVLHLSLELSDKIVTVRYLQSLLSMSRYKVQSRLQPQFIDGRIHFTTSHPKCLSDDLDFVAQKAQQYEESLARLMITEFPSGSLTMSGLRAYLDGLQLHSEFEPDVLLLDYADLMKIKDISNKRVELGQLYVELRGLASERNLALVTCTQTNRGGADAKIVETTDIAEDWSKVATADNILTYSQTKDERRLGLGRLNVAACRNNEDKFQILISQDYATGQFIISSVELTEEWEKRVNESIIQG